MTLWPFPGDPTLPPGTSKRDISPPEPPSVCLCPNCDSVVDADLERCPECDYQFRPPASKPAPPPPELTKCLCGQDSPRGTDHCPKCGFDLEGD